MDVGFKAMPAGAEEYWGAHEDLMLFGRPVGPIALKLKQRWVLPPPPLNYLWPFANPAATFAHRSRVCNVYAQRLFSNPLDSPLANVLFGIAKTSH